MGERTGGNPYDSVELVNALREDGALVPTPRRAGAGTPRPCGISPGWAMWWICWPPTVSMGVAAMISPGPDGAEQLVKLADEAVYEAKRAGRNQVWSATPAGAGVLPLDASGTTNDVPGPEC